MAQRKCSKCGHWNTDLDYCEKCNNLLNLQLQVEIEQQQKEERRSIQPPDRLDRLFDAFKHSRFLPIRILYHILYSIWLVFIAVLSFFMYILAWGPG